MVKRKRKAAAGAVAERKAQSIAVVMCHHSAHAVSQPKNGGQGVAILWAAHVPQACFGQVGGGGGGLPWTDVWANLLKMAVLGLTSFPLCPESRTATQNAITFTYLQ